jgi:hypothetical protein
MGRNPRVRQDRNCPFLFNAEKDRPEYADPNKRIPAAIRHANLDLAWERWHEEQGK